MDYIIEPRTEFYCQNFASLQKGLKMLRWHFSVLFSWDIFCICERVFAEVIDMAENSLYNSY
ncbi:hypothetical protein D7X87_17265 [bacterium D16-54]|nr:hypothetical protein D7X87_17265 [bacterium D16-54]RKJ13222.1 hypothetical protein D7X65_17400 [bacterium D16-56]